MSAPFTTRRIKLELLLSRHPLLIDDLLIVDRNVVGAGIIAGCLSSASCHTQCGANVERAATTATNGRCSACIMVKTIHTHIRGGAAGAGKKHNGIRWQGDAIGRAGGPRYSENTLTRAAGNDSGTRWGRDTGRAEGDGGGTCFRLDITKIHLRGFSNGDWGNNPRSCGTGISGRQGALAIYGGQYRGSQSRYESLV